MDTGCCLGTAFSVGEEEESLSEIVLVSKNGFFFVDATRSAAGKGIRAETGLNEMASGGLAGIACLSGGLEESQSDELESPTIDFF